jgi:acetolactate synthase-1/2/3 large subunit
MPHTPPNNRTAAEVLVDHLVAYGVDHVFCVPGESYLSVLDAFHDRDIAVTVCRQEGAAAMMADAYGKSTGRPGICFVTRGPGATNASAGIHVAHQDSTPLILFVGQVQRSVKGRESFQELDYVAVFGSMTKWATEVDDAERMPEIVARAFHLATNGRPGPVVVALPRDVLDTRVAVEDIAPTPRIETAPGPADMDRLSAMLAEASRPIVVVGGSRWDEASRAVLHAMAEHLGLPVMTSYRRAPLFDALHPHYAGDLGLAPNPKLVARVRDADLLVVIGARLSEIATQGYGLFDGLAHKPKLVHVYPAAEELGRVFRPDLAIHATPKRFVEALSGMPTPQSPGWSDTIAAAHDEYLAWSEVATPQPGGVNLGEVMVWLRENLPADAILCNGAGNYAAWIHRFFRFRRFGSHVAPTSASMGYGIPAAVAMARLHPDRLILSVNGDGDFLMNGADFATAVQYELPIVALVADNGIYGTIRMHQERAYPGRVSATTLRNPDFAAYARAFGGFGVTVERTADFGDAFAVARASGLPSIIHLKIDPEAITPSTTLSAIREKALASV